MNQIFPKAAWSNLTPLLAAVLSLLLAGCGQPKSPPLRVGINAWPPYEFLFLAQEKGFFRDAGVDVKLVEFGSLYDARQAFENGKLDGWAATLVEVVMVHDGAMRKPRILRLLDFSDGADVIIAGKDTQSIRDLRGKRVSLDEPGSGTLVDARLILSAYGLKEADLQASYLPAQRVSDSLKAGNIDAFFSVSGWPQSAVAELAATVGIELVPIAGPQAEALIKQYAFFSADEIPDLAYKGVEGVKTVGVHALWVTSSKQPDDLIYQITAAL